MCSSDLTGFFMFFFGVGSVLTALVTLLGSPTLMVQGLVFIVISLACVILLRNPLLTKFHFRNRVHTVDSLVGEIATTLETINPQCTGRVEMRGSTWSAVNTGPEPIPLAASCRVEKVEGLTLHVKI